MTVNPMQPGTFSAPAAPSSQPVASPTATASKLAPVDPVKLLRQHMVKLIVTAVIGAVLGVGIHYALLYTVPKYSTTAYLQAGSALDDPYKLTGETAANSGNEAMSAYLQNQIVRLKSDDIILDVLKNEQVRQTGWFKSFASDNPNEPTKSEGDRVQQAKYELQKRALSASQIRGSSLISVSMTGSEQGDLTTILGAVLNVYFGKLRLDADTRSTDIRRTFLDERKRAEEDIVQIQNQIKQFAIDNDMPNLQSQGHEATIAYQLVADQASKLEIAAQGATDSYQQLLQSQQQGKFTYTPEEIAEVEMNQAVMTRDEAIRLMREEREVALHKFSESHQYVKDIDRRIAAKEQERKREYDRLLLERQQVKLTMAKNQADTLQAQMMGLQPKLEEARNRMRDLNLKLQTYANLADQLKAATDRRDKSTEMLNSVRISSSRPESVRMIQVQSPTEPLISFPKPQIVIPGVTLLGLAIVLGVLYMKEASDLRIKSPLDLRSAAQIDCLGQIPDSQDDPSRPARVESIVQDAPTGLMAECYRQVRTAVLDRMERLGHKTLLVTAPQPGSGTSAVASNLAMSSAYLGRKVLLIDANLRRPNQHAVFGIAQKPGLIELIRGQATLTDAVFQKVEPSLHILPAGQCKDVPPELLETAAFKKLMLDVSAQYDLIVIDAPPGLVTSDCQLLARQADSLLVVVRAMADERGMLTRLMRQVSGLKAKPIGGVLNGVRIEVGGYLRENYEQFYRYNQPHTVSGAPVAPKPTA